LKKIPHIVSIALVLFTIYPMRQAQMKKPRKKIRRGKGTSRDTKAARRKRLERATAAYFRSLSGEALEEEKRLEAAVAAASSRINFDE
jgi:hypothetical protein